MLNGVCYTFHISFYDYFLFVFLRKKGIKHEGFGHIIQFTPEITLNDKSLNVTGKWKNRTVFGEFKFFLSVHTSAGTVLQEVSIFFSIKFVEKTIFFFLQEIWGNS